MLDDFEKKIKKINDTIKDKNISFSLFGDWGVTYQETSTFIANNFKDARLLILNRDNFQCQICYKTSDLQIDHVIPLTVCIFSSF